MALKAKWAAAEPVRMSDPANIRPDAFAGTAEAYARWRPPYPRPLLDWLVAETGGRPGARLLDLATGPGRIALDLAGRFAEVWALDLEPEMIAVARAAAARRGIGNIVWSVGRAEDFEASAGGVDLITVGEALQRLEQPLIARKARGWLKPGGAFATMGGGAILNGDRAWHLAAVALARRWTAKAFPNGWAQARTGVDPSLEASMRVIEGAGFQLIANRTFPQSHAWTFEAVLGYFHSTSVASLKVLGDDAEAFAAELKATLAPFADANGLLQDEIAFGCTLFRRPD
jgi:ubiquinone/menaquinone biosynthesis C-methylase UbiE